MIMNKMKKLYYLSGAAITIGTMSVAGDAHATGFNSVAKQIADSTSDIPKLVGSLSYIVGALLAALGVMKIKDHVENPTQTPLKDGAIRLVIGGALFALPTLMDAMTSSIGSQTGTVTTPTLKSSSWN